MALRDHPSEVAKQSGNPWSSLVSRRFGGDSYERVIHLQPEEDFASSKPVSVSVKAIAASPGHFDIVVRNAEDQSVISDFRNVVAELPSSTLISATIDNAMKKTTVVSQVPPASLPAAHGAPNTMERLHVFGDDGRKVALVVTAPNWLLSLGEDVLDAAATKGALKAPMPSLVVEVKVNVGDKVEKGQAVIVLESMKTETVLRANAAGVVKSVGCKNGEMVEEGRHLVEFNLEEEASST